MCVYVCVLIVVLTSVCVSTHVSLLWCEEVGYWGRSKASSLLVIFYRADSDFRMPGHTEHLELLLGRSQQVEMKSLDRGSQQGHVGALAKWGLIACGRNRKLNTKFE